MSDEKKMPTIAELEAMLNTPHKGYIINPDGSISPCEDEITRLQSALTATEAKAADLARELEEAFTNNSNLRSEIVGLRQRIRELTEALR